MISKSFLSFDAKKTPGIYPFYCMVHVPGDFNSFIYTILLIVPPWEESMLSGSHLQFDVFSDYTIL